MIKFVNCIFIFVVTSVMINKFFYFFLLLTPFCIFSQEIKAYQFYNKNKEKVDATKVFTQLSDFDVVLFGENHNSSINHWLQLKSLEKLVNDKKKNIVVGAEMFERDNQSGLTDYISGKIDAKVLKDSVRLWNNYATDYSPLVEFAKKNGLRFIATNVPRKYASQVAKQGLGSLNSLPPSEKLRMAKLPIEVSLQTPGYSEMKEMMGDHADNMKVMNFISAQAIKDATMAESILNNRSSHQLFIHFNGNYHSKEYGGIYWYLKKANPKLKIAVISIFESDDQELPLENDVVATEFNLVIPADMTKTY